MMLAQNVGNIFGKVTPPAGAYNANPVAGLGKLIVVSIQLFFVGAGILLLFFLLWGGFDWVMSGGEKERLEMAQQKITNALIGFFIVIAALTLFVIITGDIFGIIKVGNGFRFTLPTLQDVPQRGGAPAPTYQPI